MPYGYTENKNILKDSLSLIIIIIASFVTYANALKNGFVYDDVTTIVNSSLIKNLSKLPSLFKEEYFTQSGEVSYRPIVTATYFLDYAIFGLKAWGFHLTNIILHAINGVLLYRFLNLIIRTSAANQPAQPFLTMPLLISLLFVSHTVLTEAVNAISYREDLLLFLFFISALILYIKARSKQVIGLQHIIIPYIVSSFLYFLALLSKEMAITFPLIIYCYEKTYRSNGKDSRSVLFSFIGYGIVTLIYLYLRFYYFLNPAGKSIYSWPLKERLLTLPLLILNYIKLIFFPISLSAEYNISPIKSVTSSVFIFSTILILSFIAIAFLIKKKQQGISFGIFFFFITLMPIYNIIPISNPFTERYLYLPIIGLTIIVVSVTSKLTLYQSYKTICTILIFIFICLTIQRNTIWKDEHTLWSDALSKAPNSAKAHYSMGTIYASKDMIDAAIKEYEESIRFLPTNPDSLSALGLAYYKKGRGLDNDKELIEKAYMLYKTALEIDPSHPSARYNIAFFYYEQGQLGKAIDEYIRLLKYNPNDFDAHIGIGSAYFQMGLYEKALSHYKLALNVNPDLSASYTNIGIVYLVMGQADEAMTWFKKGLRIDPNSAEAHYNLGRLYENIGKKEEAKEAYRKALKSRHDYEEAKERLRRL